MNISLNSQRDRFELEQNGLIAVAEFHLQPGVMTITHVIVPPSLRGGGIASALATEVLAYARREGIKIEPQCPFMAAYFARHPQEQDLLA